MSVDPVVSLRTGTKSVKHKSGLSLGPRLCPLKRGKLRALVYDRDPSGVVEPLTLVPVSYKAAWLLPTRCT